MGIIEFCFRYFWLIIILILLLIFRSMGKRKKFIKKAKKSGWMVEGKAVNKKYGHYSRSERQERHTCTVTYKYEVNGKEYFIKKEYYSDSGPNVHCPEKVTVYYNLSNPKRAYV